MKKLLILLTLVTTFILDAKTEFFHWKYKNDSYTLEASFPEEMYEFYRSRSRNRDYVYFATDTFDDKLINSFAKSMHRLSRKNFLSKEDEFNLVIAFIQALPYTTDEITAGVGEYARFPFETLFEKGGDCEDTAILACAILTEMGYDCLLVRMDDHMAMAINYPANSGTHFTVDGKKYYYLETTGLNWKLGEVPEEYSDQSATPIPLVHTPYIEIEAEWKGDYYLNSADPSIDLSIDLTLTNLGSADANDLTVLITIEDSNGSIIDQFRSIRYHLKQERTMKVLNSSLRAYKRREYQVIVTIFEGEDVVGEIISDWEYINE